MRTPRDSNWAPAVGAEREGGGDIVRLLVKDPLQVANFEISIYITSSNCFCGSRASWCGIVVNCDDHVEGAQLSECEIQLVG